MPDQDYVVLDGEELAVFAAGVAHVSTGAEIIAAIMAGIDAATRPSQETLAQLASLLLSMEAIQVNLERLAMTEQIRRLPETN